MRFGFVPPDNWGIDDVAGVMDLARRAEDAGGAGRGRATAAAKTSAGSFVVQTIASTVAMVAPHLASA